MISYKIFIAHTSENQEFARFICENLKNIVPLEPYLAQDYPSYGENFKDRIQYAIENCRFFIVLMDHSALANQWVNQELGYACAVKKRKVLNYNIIPISDSSIQLKGMITKDTEDILFSDKMSKEILIANLISAIRSNIPLGLLYRTLQFKVTCRHCYDKVRLHFVYTVDLPEHGILKRAVEQGLNLWETTCPNCGNKNYTNIYTFSDAQPP